MNKKIIKIISKKDYSVDTFKVSGVPLFIFYPILTFFIIVNGIELYSQKDAPFGDGEWLKFKMSYSGF